MTFIRTFKSTLFNASYLLIGWAVHASSAYANDSVYPEKTFRAEIQIITGGQKNPAVLYGKGHLMRLEMTADGKPMVQLIDLNKSEAVMLIDMGGQKTAMRLKTESALDRFALSHSDLGTVIGNKKIASFQCSTYAVQESTVCLTSDNIALESIASSGTMRVTSLQIGDQNASLFEVPENYKVVDMGAMMGGIDPKMFDSEEGILGAIFSQTGENSDSNILSGVEKIIEAGDDEAATDAALNAMLSMMGLPEGTLSADDTTAGVLTESLDSQLDLGDAEQEKAKAMMDENQRMVDIMQREGVAGLMRDAGISESTIQDAERSQEKLGKMAQAHADKNKDLIETGVVSAPSDVEMLDLETELDALNARAETLANDGDVSEADKISIQKDALEMLQKILGGASQE